MSSSYNKSKKEKSKEVAFKHAEAYVNEYIQAEKDEIQAKRIARSQGKYYIPADAKVAFVIRIKG